MMSVHFHVDNKMISNGRSIEQFGRVKRSSCNSCFTAFRYVLVNISYISSGATQSQIQKKRKSYVLWEENAEKGMPSSRIYFRSFVLHSTALIGKESQFQKHICI